MLSDLQIFSLLPVFIFSLLCASSYLVSSTASLIIPTRKLIDWHCTCNYKLLKYLFGHEDPKLIGPLNLTLGLTMNLSIQLPQ